MHIIPSCNCFSYLKNNLSIIAEIVPRALKRSFIRYLYETLLTPWQKVIKLHNCFCSCSPGSSYQTFWVNTTTGRPSASYFDIKGDEAHMNAQLLRLFSAICMKVGLQNSNNFLFI